MSIIATTPAYPSHSTASAYPNYATASIRFPSTQLSSLQTASMSVATVPAIPSTSMSALPSSTSFSALPRSGSVAAMLPTTTTAITGATYGGLTSNSGSIATALPITTNASSTSFSALPRSGSVAAMLPTTTNVSTGATYGGLSRQVSGTLGTLAAPWASSTPNSGQILASSTSYSGQILASSTPYSGQILASSTPYSGQILASSTQRATVPASYSNSYANPTYTQAGYGYGGNSYTPGYGYGGKAFAYPAQYLKYDGSPEVEDAYAKFEEKRREYLDEMLYGKKHEAPLEPTPSEPPHDDPAPEPEHHSTGIVGKIKDTVHNIEHKVMDTVHNVEHKVEEKVHAVEEKVSNVVHAVHDKVSGFFGMIGGLFHKKKDGEGHGPAGHKIGKGSTVEVTQEDGSKKRGHVVEHVVDGCHMVQYHDETPGELKGIPENMIAHVTDYAPVVGAGVEVLFDGRWYPGHVVALPMEGEAPLYTVSCHGDDPDQVTYADEASIRPLLSPEEKAVVASHMQEISEQEAAEKAAAEAKFNAQLKADSEAKQKTDFKNKMDAAGLTAFHGRFLNDGYDTEESLVHMHDGELESFGMRAGHVAKFYQAFPRGSPYVISNVLLKSTAKGISYRRTKDLQDDSHRIALFDEPLLGTVQEDGWLKVGNMYIPMEFGGKKVVFVQGEEPSAEEPEAAEEEEEQPKGAVAKVEDKVKSGLHSFAHMLHFV